MDQQLPPLQISQTKFALDLLRETDSTKSVVISPISISMCLGMTLMGAKNKTAKEIQDAIAGDLGNQAEIHQHFSNIYAFTNQNKNLIKMANKSFCSQDIKLIDEYKAGIQELYNGNLDLIDFTDTKMATKVINQYIANATDNKVMEFIKPQTLQHDIGLLLISTLNFEGEWEETFKLHSNLSIFYLSPTSTKEITMMKEEFICFYSRTKNYQFVRIPYRDNLFFMCVLLPNERFGLSNMLQNIDAKELLILTKNRSQQKGTIVIPKFETDSSFNLSEILKNLNIKEAFNKQTADFSGISETTKLFISAALHKAIINVTETGTTASSAASVTITKLSKSKTPKGPFEFIANHPFLYFITDKSSNIYFIGTFCG